MRKRLWPRMSYTGAVGKWADIDTLVMANMDVRTERKPRQLEDVVRKHIARLV